MKFHLRRQCIVICQFHLMLLAFFFVNFAKADIVIGARSLAAECYLVSRQAAVSGSASRVDLDICNRAINEVGLPVENLIGSYVNRGIIQMAMSQNERALADFNQALSMDSNSGEAYVNRGNLWFSKGSLTKAVDDYDQAIKLGVKQQHIAFLNRGIARETLGYLSAAEKDYKSALSLINDWPDALSRLERVTKSIQQERKKRASSKG